MMVQVCHVYYTEVHNILYLIYTILYTLDPYIYYYSYFGSGNGPIVWNSVYCGGWEQDIHDCSKSVYPNFYCPSSYIAGVLCKEGQFIK